MNEPIFRASYTILDQWTSGNWEQAIKMYFKLDKFVTRAMEDGRQWHEQWAKHVMETKTLPAEFGGGKLIAPIAEQKTVVHLQPWLDLVGVIDCYDKPIIYEWKTGKQSSEVYAGSKQGGIYAVLGTMSNKLVEKVEIHHFDQYTKKTDVSMVWVTDQLMTDTYNWIETIAAEMHQYFLTNDLYNRYGGNLLIKNASHE